MKPKDYIFKKILRKRNEIQITKPQEDKREYGKKEEKEVEEKKV